MSEKEVLISDNGVGRFYNTPQSVILTKYLNDKGIKGRVIVAEVIATGEREFILLDAMGCQVYSHSSYETVAVYIDLYAFGQEER